MYRIKNRYGWIAKGMDMIKKMMIILMVSGGGLQAMCVQLRDMPVAKSTLTKDTSVAKSVEIGDTPMILPKAFIAESPILQDIEENLVLRRMKLHGLFEGQPMHVVLRVIEYQEALCLKKALTIECRAAIERAYDIALIKRLGLNVLLAEYLKLVQPKKS